MGAIQRTPKDAGAVSFTRPRGRLEASRAKASVSTAAAKILDARSATVKPKSVNARGRDVLLNRRPPNPSSRRVTARETVATDTPKARAAAANERSSAPVAHITRPSRSGSFDIDNHATIDCDSFLFQ